ncbi:MAG TPA: MFS transporter, partial [Cellulomonas sp.]
AWLILVACCALFGASVGVIGNSAGIYLVPVSEDMGWSLADLNSYLTFVALFMTVSLPVAGWVLPRTGIRFILAGAVTLAAVVYGASSLFTSLAHWYAGGALLGIAFSFLFYLPVPLLVNNWFRNRNGLAIGVAAAFASVVAAVANPVGSRLIEQIGWRETRVVMAVVAWVMAVPLVLLVVRLTPGELGLRPYGAEEVDAAETSGTVAAGVAAGSAPAAAAGGAAALAPVVPAAPGPALGRVLRSAPFLAVLLLSGLLAMSASMLQQVPSVAAGAGLSPTTGATGVSAIMVGGILGKLCLGWVFDHLGILPTTLIAAGLGATGALVVLAGGAATAVFLLGCFVFGGAYAGLTVIPPLAVRQLFGTAGYSRIYSCVTVALGLFAAVAPVLFARIHDVTGSFDGAWWVCVGSYAAVGLLMAVAVRTARTSPALSPVAVAVAAEEPVAATP